MRLFAALVPPEPVREGLVRAAAGRLSAGFRATPVERVHLTLLFLGQRSEAWLEDFRRDLALRLERRAALEVRCGRPGSFPEGERARVLWMGAEPEAELRGLHEACRLAAAQAGEQSGAACPEAFRPHLTLARARGKGPAAVPPGWNELEGPRGWRAEGVSVIRSHLGVGGGRGPGGPRYEELLELPFPSPP